MVRKDRKKKNKNKLTDKEKLFREEYLKNGFNITRAYMKSHKTGHEESAASMGSTLFRKVKIRNYIDKRINQAFRKLKVDNNILIAGYVNEAYVDTRCFFEKDGKTFVGMQNLNIAQQACIETLEISNIYENDEDGNKTVVGEKTKIKFYSRKMARDMLMKYAGLIKEGNTVVFNNLTNVDAKIIVAKQLKEELGADRTVAINKMLQEA
jgi:hypothetical protein